MPAAMEYLNNTDSRAARELEDAFVKELSARRKLIDQNWRYYRGEHAAPLRADSTKTNDNVVVNLVGMAVDKELSGMMGSDDQGDVQGVRFDIVDEAGERGLLETMLGALGMGGEEQAHPEQQWLDMVWEANRRDVTLLTAFSNAAIAGHTFVKLLPSGAVHPVMGTDVPRLVALNPYYVSAFWQADDAERVLWYRIEYDRMRQDIVRERYDNGADTGRWLIYNYRKENDRANWALAGDVEIHPYAWAPIVDWKNLPDPTNFYGRDSIGIAGAMNDSLNFVLSNTQRIIKYHAHPNTVVTGANKADFQDTAVNRLWTIANENARVTNVEMQSDLSSSMGFAAVMREALFAQFRELDPLSVQDKLGAITNFGLRVMYSDTLNKQGVKRMLATPALLMLCRNILEIGGYNRSVIINALWPDTLPNDRLAEAQQLQIMTGLGLSNETALERAGYDPEQERQRRALTALEGSRGQQIAIADRLRAGMAAPPTNVPEGGPIA